MDEGVYGYSYIDRTMVSSLPSELGIQVWYGSMLRGGSILKTAGCRRGTSTTARGSIEVVTRQEGRHSNYTTPKSIQVQKMNGSCTVSCKRRAAKVVDWCLHSPFWWLGSREPATCCAEQDINQATNSVQVFFPPFR